jgi:hypothetical protein
LPNPEDLVLAEAERDVRDLEQYLADQRIRVFNLGSVTSLTMPDLSYMRNPQDRQLYESGLRLALGEAE